MSLLSGQLCGYGGFLKSDRILDGGRTERDCHGIMPNWPEIRMFPPFSPSPMKSVEADMQIDMSGNQRFKESFLVRYPRLGQGSAF